MKTIRDELVRVEQCPMFEEDINLYLPGSNEYFAFADRDIGVLYFSVNFGDDTLLHSYKIT